MVTFIDDHHGTYGVEPICRVLPIAPSTYDAHKGRAADPACRPARAQRDERLQSEIERVWKANHAVYGGAESLARTPPPRDLVQRTFAAARPNQLWLADFTYVATWRGMVYVALEFDACSRHIVSWRASRSMWTDLVLDALEQALQARQPDDTLVHHSDRGVQYLSIRYTERLAEAGIAASVGSRGDADDNALAESVIGLFKTEVIWPQGPWRGLDAVEYATLEWVWWFNHHRLLEPLGYLPPVEYEAQLACTRAAPVAA